MSKHGCILLQTVEGWQLAALTEEQAIWHEIAGGLQASPRTLAEEVDAFVSRANLARQVVIAMDSPATLAKSLEVVDSSELRDRRRLSYQLEESIPVAAEDFVADYIVDGSHVLGIATETESLLPLLTALEDRDLHVQSIAPMAIQALQSLFDRGSINGHALRSFNLIAWQNGARVEFFRVGQRLREWLHLSGDCSSVPQRMGAELIQSEDPTRVLLIDCGGEMLNTIKQLGDLDVHSIESASMTEHTYHGACATASGKQQPWIELLRGELTMGDPYRAIRRSLNFCLVAAAVLLVALTTLFLTRSRQYHRQALASQQRQEQLFQDVFPNSRVPTAVNSRLNSEHRKLLGARGDEAAVRLPPSALHVLHQLVTGLPETIRLQVEQMRIENGQIDLDVNVRTVGAAGQLADALQKRGFEMEPPTTEQRDANTVVANIHGGLATAREN